MSRSSAARVMVERDITLPMSEEVWLETLNIRYWQKAEVEYKSKHCTRCKIFVHNIENCFVIHPELRPSQDLSKIKAHMGKKSQILEKHTDMGLAQKAQKNQEVDGHGNLMEVAPVLKVIALELEGRIHSVSRPVDKGNNAIYVVSVSLPNPQQHTQLELIA